MDSFRPNKTNFKAKCQPKANFLLHFKRKARPNAKLPGLVSKGQVALLNKRKQYGVPTAQSNGKLMLTFAPF